jgi:tetratricopeptide (TPR) repeat protein
MKNNILFYVIIICVFPFYSFAQKENVSLVEKKTKNIQTSDIVSGSERTVKTYHVEENIKMSFGGYTTTYSVSDSTLVNTNDLGPNNTRVVTKEFVETKQLIDTPTEAITDSIKMTVEPSVLKPSDPLKRQSGYASVFMIKTYERVAEKGYKSVDIFQKLGNAFYFNDELDKAARWYGELFAITSDLKPEFYYRYFASLKAIGKNEKANEMLARFNQLSGNDDDQ